ncbi:DNA repair protein RecO [Thermaurantimonas aggregans]|uniref:DNA repair protein RecO n=1 Tax=Thermaurantimonas aggregans TaxID=2173829 RepID=UPI0023F33D67|nr:DNA repair protein RecO [Thermaurantimonas aggregans]MCX8148331.1 DNA repair protein RecO [Thermaurantimonas aggregans]
MYTKVRAILLSSVAASGGAVIITSLTDVYGKISLITKGIHSKKALVKPAYLMPLNILDLQIDFRQNKDLHYIREAKPFLIPSSLEAQPVKRAISFFVAEVLQRSLHEHQPLPAVFEFVLRWIEAFDESEHSTGLIVHWLLAHLIKVLGIEPNLLPGNHWLDLVEGKSVAEEPYHPHKVKPELATQLYLLFNQTNMYNPDSVGKTTKAELLDVLLLYLRLHIPEFGTPKTLSVLKELFE